MFEKRTIKASEIVRDLRSGMSDHELMEKYQLTVRGLESLFRKLEESKAVRRSELYGRFSSFEDTVDLESTRKFSRSFLALPLRIYEQGNPENGGELLDAIEKGVGVRGLTVPSGQSARLVIASGGFVGLQDISFDAICRWGKQGDDGAWMSGFEIVTISEPDLQNLKKLIRGLALGR